MNSALLMNHCEHSSSIVILESKNRMATTATHLLDLSFVHLFLHLLHHKDQSSTHCEVWWRHHHFLRYGESHSIHPASKD